MIDALDKQTLPLIPEKRGRGRPKTGTAMTSAQKQKAYRERNKGNVTGTIVASLDENMTLRQKLLEALEKIEQLEKANDELGKELLVRIRQVNNMTGFEKSNVTEKRAGWQVQLKVGQKGRWKSPKDMPTWPTKEAAAESLVHIENKTGNTWYRVIEVTLP